MKLSRKDSVDLAMESWAHKLCGAWLGLLVLRLLNPWASSLDAYQHALDPTEMVEPWALVLLVVQLNDTLSLRGFCHMKCFGKPV